MEYPLLLLYLTCGYAYMDWCCQCYIFCWWAYTWGQYHRYILSSLLFCCRQDFPSLVFVFIIIEWIEVDVFVGFYKFSHLSCALLFGTMHTVCTLCGSYSDCNFFDTLSMCWFEVCTCGYISLHLASKICYLLGAILLIHALCVILGVVVSCCYN